MDGETLRRFLHSFFFFLMIMEVPINVTFMGQLEVMVNPQSKRYIAYLSRKFPPVTETCISSFFVGEKEANKEALRKYLELVEFFTKVLVALYEQNGKPSSTLEFIQQKLGGPSVSDYKKLQSEKSDLQIKDNEVFAKHQGTSRGIPS
ncbi:unnamed protein product [Brassica napus]|uniref:(rape) hypothetical protein n=1 Tax=Brassica napus TaxID=3708 RepID=A0A816YJE8_BRANA|nr:unnamed protein product [Brassica napus]